MFGPVNAKRMLPSAGTALEDEVRELVAQCQQQRATNCRDLSRALVQLHTGSSVGCPTSLSNRDLR
jgi:hypothetical protein